MEAEIVWAFLVSFGGLIVLAFLGVPLVAAMGIAGVGGMLIGGIPLSRLPVSVISFMENWAWLAIPLFLVLGYLLEGVGLARHLVGFGEGFVRRIGGGTSHILITLAVLIGGTTGSIIAEAGMLGNLFKGELERAGYPRGYAAAIISNSGNIGALIPPSVPLLLIAIIGEIPLLPLWLGGIGPGLLLALGLMLAATFITRRKGYGKGVAVITPKRQGGGFANLTPLLHLTVCLSVPIVILGGMRLGVFTAVEGGSIGIAYALLLGFTIYRREFSLGKLVKILEEGLMAGASYFILVGAAGIFGHLVLSLGLGDMVAQLLMAAGVSKPLFLAMIFIIFLILGMVIEGAPLILVFFPLFLPAALAIGLNPIHFGVVFGMLVLIGALTPPVGILTLFMCRLTGATIAEWWRDGWPFLFVTLGVTILTMVFPQIVLVIPTLVGR